MVWSCISIYKISGVWPLLLSCNKVISLKFLIQSGLYFEDCSESYRYHCNVVAYTNYPKTEIGQDAVLLQNTKTWTSVLKLSQSSRLMTSRLAFERKFLFLFFKNTKQLRCFDGQERNAIRHQEVDMLLFELCALKDFSIQLRYLHCSSW